MTSHRDQHAVVIGDLIKFSVGLIQQIAEEPGGLSIVVRLTEIRLAEDGSKILVLERVNEP